MTTTNHAPLILALTGRPDVGKDTVGEILCKRFGFISVAFADALRTEVCEAWRIDPRMLTHRPTKETPIPALAAGMCNDPAFMHWVLGCGESLQVPRSPRWAMQRWASFKRRYATNYYATIVDRWIGRKLGTGWTQLVITDLRDPVEEAVLRAKGAQVVRIHRPQVAALPTDTATHVSEQHHKIKADFDILNDGSLQALAEEVATLVASLSEAVAMAVAQEGGSA